MNKQELYEEIYDIIEKNYIENEGFYIEIVEKLNSGYTLSNGMINILENAVKYDDDELRELAKNIDDKFYCELESQVIKRLAKEYFQSVRQWLIEEENFDSSDLETEFCYY